MTRDSLNLNLFLKLIHCLFGSCLIWPQNAWLYTAVRFAVHEYPSAVLREHRNGAVFRGSMAPV